MTGRKSKPPGPRARKAVAKKSRARQASKEAATPSRSQAAAPLLARAPKKVGAPEKSSRVSKPQERANYQPKTEPPATPVKTQPAPAPAGVDVLAMAQPWMTLGLRMTAAGLAFQARMAKAALNMAPPAAAMRQGAEALNAWFSLMQPRPPKSSRKD